MSSVYRIREMPPLPLAPKVIEFASISGMTSGKNGPPRGYATENIELNRLRYVLQSLLSTTLQASQLLCCVSLLLQITNCISRGLRLHPMRFMYVLEVTNSNLFNIIHCHYDLGKFNFTNRVIPIWNSLSNHVVSADTVNTYKDRLDKIWSNRDVLYDYK